MSTVPNAFLSVLLPFAIIFQQDRVFQKAMMLFIGTLLCMGGVTVCAALRALGMNTDQAYSRFHRLLNRDRWNMLLASKTLLNQLLDTFKPNVITFAIDDTIERRRGKKIKAKGFFKDPLGTGATKIVTCSGLRWVPIMLLVKVSFMKRTIALPFIVVLSPSEKTSKKMNYRHKSPQLIAEQVCYLLKRWLPNRQLVIVTDAGYATRGLFRTCQKLKIQLVSRARSNGRFFDLPPQRTGKRGRPCLKGGRLPPLKTMKNDPNRQWTMIETAGYGRKQRTCWVSTTECCWAPSEGGGVICVCLVFVKDSQEENGAPVFCLITSAPELSIEVVLSTYTDRWSQEVTHRDVREHLGMETQRQWSDLSIARSTPLLFGCYSLVFLIAHEICKNIADSSNFSLDPLIIFTEDSLSENYRSSENISQDPMIQKVKMTDTCIKIAQASWYQKEEPTFSDLMASIRRMIREHQLNQIWRKHPILHNIPCPKGLLRIFEEMGIAA